ncbi:MAG: hypothetical protein NVSMB60_08070 [Mycobacterium sp.]
MALLTIQHTNIAGGLTAVYTPAATTVGGDTYANTGAQTLHVRNLAGAAVTVSIIAQNPCSQGTYHTLAYTIPPGGAIPTDLGPFAFQYYNDANGNVNVAYAAVVAAPTAVTLAVIPEAVTLSESAQINALAVVTVPLPTVTTTQVAVTAP